ncbi:MAG: patatin-like phospholipase family protein [Lachnospiraceae bacterium]|jgi:NTE family protein|nr:patatin-like phospholipase family protein [Lachnospiraceae bacterium]
MKLKIDAAKEYGVVLEGGGAKGAYQIGVWRALIEAGIRIRGLAGTSVGGLNAAFICMGDWEKARHCWENLTYSKIMSTDDLTMDKFLKGRLPLGKAWQTTVAFIKNKGYDVTPLKELIADNVDGDRIRSWPGDIVVMSFNLDTKKEEEISLKDKTDEQIHDFLLATAYMAPVFKTEPLQGAHYIDGGFGDNVPVDALIRRNYKDLIVIRIYGVGFVRNTKIPDDVHVTEIAPHKDLGSIMAFTEENSRKNIIYGYYSGMRVLYGLKGRIFYFDEEDRGETVYLGKILKMIDKTQKEAIAPEYLPGGEKRRSWLRHLYETDIPDLARELQLPEDWNYQDLFLGLIEDAAEFLAISKWNIYTVEGILSAVKKAMELADPATFTKHVKMVKVLTETETLNENGVIHDSISNDVRQELEGDYT